MISHSKRFDEIDKIGQDMFFEEIKKQDQPYDNYVDIYDFFDVFLNLLRQLNLLNEDLDISKQSPNKILLVEEFPDTEYSGQDIVTYHIGERSFNSDGGIGSSNKTFIQRKPITLDSSYDIESNNLKTDYANVFINTITLEANSISKKRVEKMTQLLESIILKYKGHLKLYVRDIIYVGQTPTVEKSIYHDRRLFSRSIVLRVITYSNYSLITEEIKEISIL